jgi:hypothetical protein
LGWASSKAVDTNQGIGTTLNQISLWDVAMFLTAVFVIVLFFVFAFSAWPSLQNSRPRPHRRPGWPQGGGGTGQPSWINMPSPDAASPYGASAPPPPPAALAGTSPEATQAQPSGWYRAGVVGSGEQEYWDGQAWTARRQWKNGAWVDLPLPDLGPLEAPTVDAS